MSIILVILASLCFVGYLYEAKPGFHAKVLSILKSLFSKATPPPVVASPTPPATPVAPVAPVTPPIVSK